jgi:hypothetical protein
MQTASFSAFAASTSPTPKMFENQIIIVGLSAQPFSAAADSGSRILKRGKNRAIGLLFAGSATHTMASHLNDALSTLIVRLTLWGAHDNTPRQ